MAHSKTKQDHKMDGSGADSLEGSRDESMEAGSSEDLQGQSEDLAPYDEAMEQEFENGLGSGARASGSEGEENETGGRSGRGGEQLEGQKQGMSNGNPSSSRKQKEGEEKEEEGGVTAVGGLQGSSQGSRSASKGPAVIHQQSLYKHFLETRILLQKVILRSNDVKLPPTDARTPKTVAAQRLIARAASQTLVQLMQVHDALLNQSQAPPVDDVQGPASLSDGSDLAAVSSRLQSQQHASTSGQGGGMTDDLWGVVSRRFEASASVREAAMERWQSRTLFQQQQGATVASGKPFRAFNQKALEHSNRKSPAAGPDGESFDDSSFYSQLLKEFLEANGGVGAHLAALHSSKGVKKHRNVDRRASKSRRLRFHVQEKLVNFMVPVHQEPPAFAGQLVANLFGFNK